jgi:testis-specific serine kinase
MQKLQAIPKLSKSPIFSAYAAPEIISGSRYDPMKSDIWSLGIVLFVMLNGEMPFEDSVLSRLLRDQKDRSYDFANDIKKTLSNVCKSVVYKLLEPNPRRRVSIEEVYAMKWIKKHVERTSKNN